MASTGSLRPTTRVCGMETPSRGGTWSLRRGADAARVERPPGRRPGRREDAGPWRPPDPPRDPRHARDARLREYRDRLRREPPGRVPPGPLVDRPRSDGRPLRPPAPRMGRERRALRARRDGGDLVLRRVGLRFRRSPWTAHATEGLAPREVRGPPDDDQRAPDDRLRPVDRVRRVVLPHAAVWAELRPDARGPGTLHDLPPVELPDLRAPVRERVHVPPAPSRRRACARRGRPGGGRRLSDRMATVGPTDRDEIHRRAVALRTLVLAAVARQPAECLLLSGGLDTSILAGAARASGTKAAVTVLASGDAADGPFATAVAGKYGLAHP